MLPLANASELNNKEQIIEEGACLLAISFDETKSLFTTIRKETNYLVTNDEILEAICLLDDKKWTTNKLIQMVNINQIVNILHIPRKEAFQLPISVWDYVGLSITYDDILQFLEIAIPPITTQDIFDYYYSSWEFDYYNLLIYISNTLNRSLKNAEQLVQFVCLAVDASVNYGEMLQAVKCISAQTLSVDNIAQCLEIRYLAKQLNLTPYEFDKWHQMLAKKFGVRIPSNVFIDAKNSAEGTVTIQVIENYFWENYDLVPMIGFLMGVPVKMIPREIRKIRKNFPYPVQDKEIVEVLEMLPPDWRLPVDVVDQLYKQRLAFELGIDRKDVNDLVAEINQNGRIKFSIKQILKAFSLLDAPNKTLSNTTGLLYTSRLWMASREQVLQTALFLIRNAPEPMSLTEVWSVMLQVDSDIRNIDDLVMYFNIQHLLKNDEPDATILNYLTVTISKLKNKKRFWDYIDNFREKGNLTEFDLNYFVLLTKWSTGGVQNLSPVRGVDERQISYQEVKEIFNNCCRVYSKVQRMKQEFRLLTYSKKCWCEMDASKRIYGIPSCGRAEIIVSKQIKSLICVTSVRFRQEGINAPGLFVQFKFADPDVVGLIRIDASGRIEGFHKMLSNTWFHAVIEAIALSHARDLVVPNDVQISTASKRHSRNYRQNTYTSASQRSKIYPRRSHEKTMYKLADWYESQRVYHNVRGHIRIEDSDFTPSLAKRRQAMAAGVKLKVHGETWIVEHERGNPQYLVVDLDGADLVRHTVFGEPPKASSELARIFLDLDHSVRNVTNDER